MARDNNVKMGRVFLGLIITLILSSFGFTVLCSGSLHKNKLSKEVYRQRCTAQDKVLEKIDRGYEKTNEKLDAIILRELEELKRVAKK